jgi:hypothetical protein
VIDDKVGIINKLAEFSHIKAVLINRSNKEMELHPNAIQIPSLLDLKKIA